MRENLPNGETGKQIASETVSRTLQGFVKCVAEEIAVENHRSTPAHGKRAKSRQASKNTEEAAVTPKTTSKKGRKKRVSFGVVETNGKSCNITEIIAL